MDIDCNAEDNQVAERILIFETGHFRPRQRENVWMCRDHCTPPQ